MTPMTIWTSTNPDPLCRMRFTHPAFFFFCVFYLFFRFGRGTIENISTSGGYAMNFNLQKTLLNMKKIKWNYTALAFVIPCFGLLTIMLFGQYEPFGNDRSMLYSDMYHQYYPFFVAFRKALRSGDSLLYSWSVGMGMEYLGLIAYYLASPLNLLSVLLPESLTLEYFSLLMPVKLGLAGMFFAIFLKKLFDKDDLSITIFGGFYALCAWALGYQWNIMWLDTFALLPLVALGTVYLLRDKKFILYTITLFLSIFANYYIGLFTCIFVLLVFICYEICRFSGFKRFFLDLLRIAAFSALAIGMTAVLSLPTLAALQNTQSSVNTFPDYFSLNMVESELCEAAREAWNVFKDAKEADAGFMTLTRHFFVALKESFLPVMDGMRQVAGNMGGGLTHTFKDGLPNLHCGVATIIFAFLFLTARGIKIRDKICSVLLLIFFMLSFVIRQLDYIWHGFHFTNQIPYRFSFLFSFVLLYMAYRAWLMRDSFKLWQLIIATVLTGGILACSNDANDFVFLVYNLSFLLLYIGIYLFSAMERRIPAADDETEPTPEELALRQKKRKQQLTLVFSAVMAFELVLNIANFAIRFPYTTVTNYPKGTEDAESAINYMLQREEGSDFYRAEATHAQTLNDGALNGYNGISTFTSSANVRVTNFMLALGYGARDTYNRYCYEEASPISNLFLNLKYMIERDGDVEENPYFHTVHNFGDVYLLENNAYLPLGFLAESGFEEANFEVGGSRFYLQNYLFSLATGQDEAPWSLLKSDCLDITSNNVTIDIETAAGYVSYTIGPNAGTVTYTFKPDRSGFMCIDVSMTARNSFRVYKNGAELYSENVSLPQMFAVSNVTEDDTIEVEVYTNSETTGSVSVKAAILDDTVFRRGYDVLAASTLDLTEFSNTHIEGTINCNRDGLLYTSIPQDGNWVATVDGKEAEIVLVGDCMIGLNMTQGQHTVTFTYKNNAFTIGLLVSLGCAVAFVAIILLSKSNFRYSGKYAKQDP